MGAQWLELPPPNLGEETGGSRVLGHWSAGGNGAVQVKVVGWRVEGGAHPTVVDCDSEQDNSEVSGGDALVGRQEIPLDAGEGSKESNVGVGNTP